MRSERDIGILLGQNFLAGATDCPPTSRCPQWDVGLKLSAAQCAVRGLLWLRSSSRMRDNARRPRGPSHGMARQTYRTADISLADESYPHTGHRLASLHAEISPRIDDLGEVVQAAAACVMVQGAFNWIQDNYGCFADWTSSANRVAVLLLGLDQIDGLKGDGVSAQPPVGSREGLKYGASFF
jgi:hypothetical protein